MAIQYDTDIYNTGKYIYNYNWYIPSWVGIPLDEITDPLYVIQLQQVKIGLQGALQSVFIQNNFNSLHTFEYTWGKKINIINNFKNINGQLTLLAMGLNFNDYFIRYSTNENIQNIGLSLQAINLFLDILYSNYVGIYALNDYNLVQTSFYLSKIYKKYTLLVITYAENYYDARLFLNSDGNLPTDLNDLVETDTLYNMIYNNGYKGNLTFAELMLFEQKIINIYEKLNYYYGQASQLNLEDTGYFEYRTDDNYWINIWKWIQLKTGQNVIISYDYNVADYLKPSIQLLGDLQMAGNLNLMSPNDYLRYFKGEVNLSEIDTLLSMYPDEQFIGLGSQKIYTQYALNYKTIDLQSNRIYAKNHVLISNPYYPNLVCERIVESADPVVEETYVKDTYSASTLRRTSNIYSIEDIVSKGEGKYGFDVSFEVQDKYNITYEIGNLGMRVNSIKTFDNGEKYPMGEFFMRIVENNDPLDGSISKDILVVDQESRLYIDKIRLGTKDLYATVDESGEEILKWGDKTIVLK